MNWRPPLAAVLALLALCWDGDETAPLDGGNRVQFHNDPPLVAGWANDPCFRREKGGWHLSVGHCRAMTPPHRIVGVWITAFEEESFLVGETRVPDPNDPRHFQDMIEFDPANAVRMVGRPPSDENGEAYLLTFIGRQTRDPLGVDCLGGATFGFVVDRLLSVKYLGPMGRFDFEALKARALRTTVTRRHDGVWGQMEEKAIKACAPHGGD